MPWKRFTFHTSACFFESYFALPAQQPAAGVVSALHFGLTESHDMHTTFEPAR